MVFRCGERRLLGAPPGAAALLRAVPGVAGTALAVLGGQEEPSGDDVAVGSVGKPMGKGIGKPGKPIGFNRKVIGKSHGKKHEKLKNHENMGKS